MKVTKKGVSTPIMPPKTIVISCNTDERNPLFRLSPKLIDLPMFSHIEKDLQF